MDIKNITTKLYTRIKNNGSLYFMRALASWLFVCLTNYISKNGIFTKEYAAGINTVTFVISFIVVYALLTLLRSVPVLKNCKTDSTALFSATAISCCYLCFAYFLQNGKGIDGFIALAPFLALCIWFTIGRQKLKAGKFAVHTAPVLILCGCAVMLIFTALSMAARYYTLSTPAFDFGIFTQMFENMKDGLGPVTTVERNYLLSHFSVHFSPAYYLMLPFYMLYPHPITLQILQGVILTSGVIPLVLICKRYNFTPFKMALICISYTVYPAFIGGCSYDIHENCMLLPLLLWLFYAIEKESLPLTAVFSILTLLVKEDAAVYVAVVGLYLIFSDRNDKMRKTGIALLTGSILYFLLICAYLESNGLGIMTWRYKNYMTSADGGLIAVILAIILNPAYVLSNLFTGDKAVYTIQTLAPLAFIPVITKRFHRYILLIPFILINLMPYYQYQHSIYFQYSFGTGALLFWLFVMNLKDIKYEQRKCVTAFSVVACTMMTLSTMTGMLSNFKYAENPQNKVIIEYLENLPVTDESITADTFFVPPLYKQKELYPIPAHTDATKDNTPLADIILLDKSIARYEKNYNFFISLGYKETETDNSVSFRIVKLIKPDNI